MDKATVLKLSKLGLPGACFRVLLVLSLGANYNYEIARITGMITTVPYGPNASQTQKVLKTLQKINLIEEDHREKKNVYYRLNVHYIKSTDPEAIMQDYIKYHVQPVKQKKTERITK